MSSPYREASTVKALPKRCLSCGGELGPSVCATCGAPAPQPDAPRAAALDVRCPRCAVSLEPCKVGEAGFVYCVGCHGCFVPTLDWDALLESVPALGPVAGDDLAPLPPGQGLPSRAILRSVDCPVCNAPMKRVAFAGDDALPVDVCGAHGIWFDASELATALRSTAQRKTDDGRYPLQRSPAGTEAPHRGALAAILGLVRR